MESGDDILRLRVTNSADSVKEQFTVRWDTRESPEMPVYVPPGQSRIIMPPKLLAGVSASSLILHGDDQEFDNRVYIADTAPETRLVVYCGQETLIDAEGARFYLDKVFAASNRFKIQLKEFRGSSSDFSEVHPSLITLVQPDAEAQSFVRSHLAQGGTVLIASPTAEAMAASIKLCGREGLLVTEATVSKYAMLGEIDFEHPILSPFAESQFSDFTGIRFWKHRTIAGLKETETGLKGPVTRTGNTVSPTEKVDRVLARFDDGDPAIIEFPASRGRVIIFASGWQPADSQFARSSKFPMLLFRLLENSTGITPRPGSQPIGSSLNWPVTAQNDPSTTGTAKLPDGSELSSLPVDQPFSKTETPGIYTLSVPDRTEQIAVNLIADESRTAPMSMEQLESYGLKTTRRESPTEPQRQRERQHQLQLAEMEQSQKLWQSILVAVIAVLLLETFLAGVFVAKTAT